MPIDLETAARTLVVVAMGQNPDKRVTASLIVALLSPKFSDTPEDEITRLVTSMIIEEGGHVHQLPVSAEALHALQPVSAVPRPSVLIR